MPEAQADVLQWLVADAITRRRIAASIRLPASNYPSTDSINAGRALKRRQAQIPVCINPGNILYEPTGIHSLDGSYLEE